MAKLFRMSSMVVLLVVFVVGSATFAETVNSTNYKLISTVECKGDGVYNSRYETPFRVDKTSLGDNTFRYQVTAGDSGKGMSFILDRDSMLMSDSDKSFQFQEQINNICVRSLDKDAIGGVGKTWKQSFDLSTLGNLYPSSLNFTLTSQKIHTKQAGDMVIVRALSEPFTCTAAVNMKCRANSVCIFDPSIEELYMSASVVTVESNSAGQGKTVLCHQTAALQTDASGEPIDLGFGQDEKTAKQYANFVRKVGLMEKMLDTKDKKAMVLPVWAKADALKISQLSNLCGGYACEQGINPVSPVIAMANHAISMQSVGYVGSTGYASVGQTLSSSLGTPSVATASFAGVGSGAAYLVGGGAAAGGFGAGAGGGSSSASP